jgi:hypothetical protein
MDQTGCRRALDGVGGGLASGGRRGAREWRWRESPELSWRRSRARPDRARRRGTPAMERHVGGRGVGAPDDRPKRDRGGALATLATRRDRRPERRTRGGEKEGAVRRPNEGVCDVPLVPVSGGLSWRSRGDRIGGLRALRRGPFRGPGFRPPRPPRPTPAGRPVHTGEIDLGFDGVWRARSTVSATVISRTRNAPPKGLGERPRTPLAAARGVSRRARRSPGRRSLAAGNRMTIRPFRRCNGETR